ncbi:small subunit of acetolactate synthase-domain-containing protein [Catenaria anguillulae PL171]|uniref:Small subunit of acetolactate synthase-domain-containing protein n=1 Tax=Catenaria anguillulae PL171 TaxID=765915 RepID=A0A1Y2I0Y9_9FUNG|nr:small subunit of acetolactate synthase-domain-containing protein [Catenaria anguillulae PL171]
MLRTPATATIALTRRLGLGTTVITPVAAAHRCPSIATRPLSTSRTHLTPPNSNPNHHRFARLPHRAATALKLPPPSLDEAVSNILYNTPRAAGPPPQRHVLNCLVTDEPGVLSRVSGILAARGFNIDSLVVSKTDVKDLSRMTIVLKGRDEVVDQAKKQLEDLVPVWAVLDYTHAKLIQREMLLAKVSLVPLSVSDQLHELEMQREQEHDAASPTSHPLDRAHKIAEADAILLATQEQLGSITRLTHLFGAKVVDVSSETAVVELCAKPERVEAFINLLHPFGLIEVARSGGMAMTRTPISGVYESEVDDAEEIGEAMDAAALPPS